MSLEPLVARLRKLEGEMDEFIDENRAQFHYRVERRKVQFEKAIREQHRKLRRGSFAYLVESGFLAVLFSPVVYSLIVPLALLDLWVSFFQMVCFPVYGIEKVKRADYIAVDRHHLAYLNWIEKLNCVYCGYANGMLAYVRAIAGRAEEHWCPIKHARRIRGAQKEYWDFAEFGDPEGYRRKGQKVWDQHLHRVEKTWMEEEAGSETKPERPESDDKSIT